jgi:hypothetical protein
MRAKNLKAAPTKEMLFAEQLKRAAQQAKAAGERTKETLAEQLNRAAARQALELESVAEYERDPLYQRISQERERAEQAAQEAVRVMQKEERVQEEERMRRWYAAKGAGLRDR